MRTKGSQCVVVGSLLLVATACSTASSGGPMGPTEPDGSADRVAPTSRDATFEAAPDGSAAAACCPPDPTIAGCMHFGGSRMGDDSCPFACDFFCSTNWRIEKDANGCDVWNYDTRRPLSGENSYCLPDKGVVGEGGADAADAAPDSAGHDSSTTGAGATCTSPTDCRAYSSYCGGCTCEALEATAPDPVCDAGAVSCLVDPCSGRSVMCASTHQCALQ